MFEVDKLQKQFISIHAAQEGCDLSPWGFFYFLFVFQSTQPKRAATNVIDCINATN